MPLVKGVKELRGMTEKEFLESGYYLIDKMTLSQFEKIKNSKEGQIWIQKISQNAGYLSSGEGRDGFTPMLAEGFSCHVILDDVYEGYYYTSNIVSGWFADYANPVFVNSVSQMTDEKKVYVLDSTGYIYAWSGSEFYNTGLQYNFNNDGYIKNAGILGDGVNLNDVVEVNQCYYLTSSNTYQNAPYGALTGLLEVRYQGLTTTQVFYSSSNGGVHTRRKTGENSWTAWEGAGLSNTGYLPDDTDLNDCLTTGFYLLLEDRTYDNLPVNVDSGMLCILTISGYTLQYIIRSSGTVHVRRHALSGWSEWRIVNNNNGMLEYNSDLNSLKNDGCWYLNGSLGANYGNMPASLVNHAAILEIIRYGSIIMQRLYGYNGAWFTRRSYDLGSTWSEWILVSNTSGSSQTNPAKFLAFGDSLMMGSVWTQGDPNPIIHFAGLANQMSTKIANACGMSGNFENLAASGVGYLPNTDHPDETIGSIIRTTSMNNVGLVVVSGARNDGNKNLGTAEDTSGSNTIMGAIKAIFEDITSRNKKTQIVLIQPTPHNRTDGEIAFTELNTGGWSLDSFEIEAKKLCAKYGVGYVGWRECTYMWHWASFTGAGGNYAHPNNEESYAQMGAYLGGKVSQYYKY